MIKIDLVSEQDYFTTLMILKNAKKSGLLTEEEYQDSQGKLVALYKPIIGSLLYQST